MIEQSFCLQNVIGFGDVASCATTAEVREASLMANRVHRSGVGVFTPLYHSLVFKVGPFTDPDVLQDLIADLEF